MTDHYSSAFLTTLRGGPVDKPLRALLSRLVADVQAREATIWLVDPEGDHIRAVFNHGAFSMIVEAQTVPTTESVVGFVALCGMPMAIGSQDYQHPAVMEATGVPVTAMVAVPIRATGTVIGTLSIVNPVDQERFSSRELSIADACALEIGSVLDLAASLAGGPQ